MFNAVKIAINTFRESIREPVFCLLLMFALFLIGHFPAIALFVFFDEMKMVVDSSMATTLLFGLFAAVLTSSHTVTQEMRNGTVLLLMSKPVHRWSFVVAKIVGVAAALVLMVFIMNCATVVSCYVVGMFRHNMGIYYVYLLLMILAAGWGMLLNYFRGTSFAAGTVVALALLFGLFAAYCIIFREPLDKVALTDLLKALVLLFCAVTAMSTIAVVCALKLEMVANLTVCAVVFFLGMVSSYLFSRQTGSEILDGILQAFYAFFPNWQFFWLADAIAMEVPIPGSYIAKSVLYMLMYITMVSIWGVVLFNRREIAQDSR